MFVAEACQNAFDAALGGIQAGILAFAGLQVFNIAAENIVGECRGRCARSAQVEANHLPLRRAGRQCNRSAGNHAPRSAVISQLFQPGRACAAWLLPGHRNQPWRAGPVPGGFQLCRAGWPASTSAMISAISTMSASIRPRWVSQGVPKRTPLANQGSLVARDGIAVEHQPGNIENARSHIAREGRAIRALDRSCSPYWPGGCSCRQTGCASPRSFSRAISAAQFFTICCLQLA